MNDPLEPYRDQRTEAAERVSRQAPSRSQSRAPGTRRASDTDSAVSRRDVANGLMGQIQTLSPILKWVFLLLLLILFAIACRWIYSLRTKQISDTVSNLSPIRNCDKEIRTLFDFHQYDSRSEGQVDINVPSDATIGLYARNWVEGHRNWLLEDYRSHVADIMQQNFQPVEVANNVSDFAAVLSGKATLRAKLEDPQYVRRILEKLLQYESIKHKHFSLAVNSNEFDRALARHKEDYKTCHVTIDLINKEIEERLRQFENPSSEIDKNRQRIVFLNAKLESINEEVPQKRRDADRHVAKLEGDIQQMEGDLARKTELEGQISERDGLIKADDLESRPINKRIKELESLIGENEEIVMDLGAKISELQPKKSSIEIKLREFEAQLSVRPLDNTDLRELVRGVGKCEQNNLEKVKEQFKNVDGSKFKESHGFESVLLKDLDQENKKVKELSEEFNELVNRASSFPLRRVEALSSAKRKILEGYRSELDGVVSLELEYTASRAKAEREITADRQERDGLMSKLDILLNRIALNKQWIIDARTRLKGDPKQLSKLRSDLNDLITTTETSIQKLEKDRKEFKIELDALVLKVGPMEEHYGKFKAELNTLISRLNVAMNDCKRIELLLKKFNEESKTASEKIELQKTRLGDLSQTLSELLHEIEAI